MIRALPYLAGLLLIAGVGTAGYLRGYAACQNDHRAELLARIEAGQKLEAARVAAAQERDRLAHQLEEKAHADPVVVHQCFGPERVRRLNALR